MSGDLPEKGSFLTSEDWGVRILATRDGEGRFRAFLNACRHRGVAVESEPRGRRTRLEYPTRTLRRLPRSTSMEALGYMLLYALS